MGTIKQGILGGFSGKVGTVVGAFWRGKAYMRGIAPNVKQPNTADQQDIRKIFGMLAHLTGKMRAVIVKGFKQYAVGITEQNAFMSYNWYGGAVAGIPGNREIDYAKLLVSRGNLPLPYDMRATANPGEHRIALTWTDNTGIAGAEDDDAVMYVAYNADLDEVMVNTDAADRADESCAISYPAAWADTKAQVFMSIVNRNSGECAQSMYLGEFVC